MKLKHAQFVSTVSFGGQLQSISVNVVGDRPGQTGAVIELDEKMRFVSITKLMNGQSVTRVVPMSNIACYEALEVAPAVKK